MPSSPGYEKNCTRCNVLFMAKKKGGKFCSKSCGTKYRFENTTKFVECPFCGEVVIKHSNNQSMCGKQSCHSKAQVARSYKYLNGNKEAYISLLLKKKGRGTLSLEYILKLFEEQKGLCALSGKEMTFIKIPNSEKVHTNLSIDRIDSSLPYVEGNIQLVCAVTNVMKTTLTMSELYEWCEAIITARKS